MLNAINGDWFDEYLLTPERSIEVKVVHFYSTYFQLENLHTSLVGVQRTESTTYSQRG